VLHIDNNPKKLPGKTFSRTYLERYWKSVEQIVPNIPIDNLETVLMGFSYHMGSSNPDFTIKELFRKVGVKE